MATTSPPVSAKMTVVEALLSRYFPVARNRRVEPAPSRAELARYEGSWLATRRNYSRVGAGFGGHSATQAVDDGVLLYPFRGAPARWSFIGNDRFQREGGHQLIAFAFDGDRATHLYAGGAAYEPVGYWRTRRGGEIIQGIIGLLSLLTLLAIPIAWRYRDREPAKLGLARWLRVATAIVWIALIIAGAGEASAAAKSEALLRGWPPPSLQLIVWLANVMAALTLALLATLPRALKAPVHWRLKAYHGLFVTASLLGLWLAFDFNLVGFQY